MRRTNKKCSTSCNNKGYSMVEMIIVIAIVAILSTLSFITVNIIRSAKAKAAGNAFNTQLSHLASLTKAQNPDLAMNLYYKTSENKYYIRYGTYDGTNFVVDVNTDEVGLSDTITIYYEASGATETQVGEDGVTIMFNKSDGAVRYGAGKYRIAKGNGNLSYSIMLNKNTGSHYIK